MAAIHDLLSQIQDESLRERINEEVNRLTKTKKFGLVFEQHMPECTPLFDLPIKVGSDVMFRNTNIDTSIFVVLKLENNNAICGKKNNLQETRTIPLQDLVRVAVFGEPIYPYLKPIDSVCNAPDSDLWHILIEADNYHALQLLEYLYAGKVDCIYIDPPYNKEDSKDWKYNCNYVDKSDKYRHSKWLAFMERRLKLASKLLNPNDSILIVAIDDIECYRLGLLLEQVFPSGKITMISSVINPGGKGKKGGTDFSKIDEYIFFVQIGNASILPEIRENERTPIKWRRLIRETLANGRGKHGKGACGPNQFYPIYVDDSTQTIREIGEPIPENVSRFSVPQIDGCTAVFPIRPDGTEMNWGCVPAEARRKLSNGYLRVSGYYPDKPQPYVIQYLTSGSIRDIETGKVTLEGFDVDGSVIGYYSEGKPKMPTTQWNKPSHNGRTYGTDLLNLITGGVQRFDYPKSLYAVRDCLNTFVANKPNALILDFFAGSGTTMHATNLLNAEDNGHRRCICITNNEVKASEQETFTQKGLHQGDPEWEKYGIAQYVTWPRTKCSVLGVDVNGVPLPGNYGCEEEVYEEFEDDLIDPETNRPIRGTVYKKAKKPVYPELAHLNLSDGFKANVAFFKLGFLYKTKVSLGLCFNEMIPTLWLKAGAIGNCPIYDKENLPDMLIFPENRFAVLVNEKAFSDFEEKISHYPEIQTVFLITDYDSNYKSMVKSLSGKTTYQLYRDYIDNFRINHGRI